MHGTRLVGEHIKVQPHPLGFLYLRVRHPKNNHETYDVEGRVPLRGQRGDGLGVVQLVGHVVRQEQAPRPVLPQAEAEDALLVLVLLCCGSKAK